VREDRAVTGIHSRKPIFRGFVKATARPGEQKGFFCPEGMLGFVLVDDDFTGRLRIFAALSCNTCHPLGEVELVDCPVSFHQLQLRVETKVLRSSFLKTFLILNPVRW